MFFIFRQRKNNRMRDIREGSKERRRKEKKYVSGKREKPQEQ